MTIDITKGEAVVRTRRNLVCLSLLAALAAGAPGCGGTTSTGPKAEKKHDMPLAKYKSTRPSGPHTFILDSKLDDVYVGEFADAKATHYSFFLSEPGTYESFTGFIAKNHPDADKLVALSKKDSSVHQICVEVEYPETKQSKEAVKINRVVSFE
jgi:hypothetical protein